MKTLNLRELEEGCELHVRVQPNARRSAFAGIYNQSLKVALRAPAVDGKANRALVEFLAEFAGVARSQIEIARGEKSREKTVRLGGISALQLRERLLAAGIEARSMSEGTE